MPVNINVLAKLLCQAQYDIEETKFITNGFKNGFDLKYCGPMKRRDKSRNLPLSIGNRTEMWNKIMKEVEQEWYAGPLEQVPFEHFVQSPIGLVPKAGGQTRLIFHLSYDFISGFKSVNHYTPKCECSVKYNDLDHAVMNSLYLLKLCRTGMAGKTIWYSKTDIKSAFRILPLRPGVYWLLVMSAMHPLTKKTYYFVHKCLPFGHSISCALFQRFSSAIAFIFKLKSEEKWRMKHCGWH